jgi:hypothetical protein
LISHPVAEPIIALFAQGSKQIRAFQTIVHSVASHFDTNPLSREGPSGVAWAAHEAPLGAAAQITILLGAISAARALGGNGISNICSSTHQWVFADLAFGITTGVAGQT